MPGTVLSTALMAVIVTKLVDLARKFDPSDKAHKALWLILSLIFGVLIAVIWEVNTLADLGVKATTKLQGRAGQVLTGLLVGGFGSGWHEVFDALSSSAKASRSAAVAAATRPATR